MDDRQKREMRELQRVVLFGDSLVLASLGASLQAYPSLEVVPLKAQPDQGALHTLCPNVVILDLQSVQIEGALSLLRQQPDLLLIGVDPAGDQLLVLSSHPARALTTDDLVRMIEKAAYI